MTRHEGPGECQRPFTATAFRGPWYALPHWLQPTPTPGRARTRWRPGAVPGQPARNRDAAMPMVMAAANAAPEPTSAAAGPAWARRSTNPPAAATITAARTMIASQIGRFGRTWFPGIGLKPSRSQEKGNAVMRRAQALTGAVYLPLRPERPVLKECHSVYSQVKECVNALLLTLRYAY